MAQAAETHTQQSDRDVYSPRPGSPAKAAAVVTVIVGAIVAAAIVTFTRGFGHGVEAFAGGMTVLIALSTLTGAGTMTVTIGKDQFMLGQIPGGSAQAWALRLMPLALGVTCAIVGAAMFAHAVEATSSAQIVRISALAMVPTCLALAFVRWALRNDFEAARAGAPEGSQETNIELEVPKPSEQLQGVLANELSRHPALHSLVIVGVAAFLVVLAISPPLASTVSEIVDYPWQLMDDVFERVFGWLPGI